MQTSILKKNLPKLVFTIVVCIFVISLYQRVPDEDEAVIAGHSYFFNKLGYVKSDLYGGYLEGPRAWEIRQFAYHKGFVLTGSVFLKIFGFNIYVFKMVSLVFSILLLAFLYRYLKKFHSDFSIPFYLLLCSLLLYNNTFLNQSFEFRPEIMVMCLGFVSFYFLVQGLNSDKRYYFLLAGMFAGLAAFTHLNGLIYSFAGILLLLRKKAFRSFFYFAIPAGLFSLLYLFDIHSNNDLQSLLYQFRTDPNVFDKVPFYIGLIDEQMRFFHSPREIVFSLLFLFSLILNFKSLKSSQSNLLWYLLFLVLGLAMLAHGKTAKYGLNYMPYMAIIIVTGFREILQQKTLVKLTGSILIFAFIVIHGYYNVQLIGKRINISDHNKLISDYINDNNVKISGPSVFVFNEIKNFIVRGEIAWDHHYYAFHQNEPKTLENYFAFASKNGDKYVVIDNLTNTRKTLREVFSTQLKSGDLYYGFVVIVRTPELLVLKKL